MMKITLIILALFSFLHEERYEISNYQCTENEIKVEYDNTWYDISLFNVFLKKESDVCEYLDGDISIEFDAYVKIENPLNVYLFVNDKLLQQILIDHQEASIKIENPKYKYQLKKKEVKVMKPIEDNKKEKEIFSTSKKIAVGLIIVWFLICLLLLCLKIKVDKIHKKEN